jgi:lipopolysaccharide/colanic/teichoic acid biosynthesis glycosyltransferase
MTVLQSNESVNVGNWSQTPVTLSGVQKSWFYFFQKRLLDFAVASVLLILITPMLILLSILIVLDSPGSFLFVQQRVGAKRRYINGKQRWVIQNFNMYKFRSMRSDVDTALHQKHIQAYVAGDLETLGDGETKLKGEMSVTRIGRFIRRTSLDELPQLINVLKGEMSLVGPRPVPVYEVAQYKPAHYERLCATPGITGLWQIRGRCDTTFEEQIHMDIEYIHNQSFLFDLKILFLTIPVVVSGRGAA